VSTTKMRCRRCPEYASGTCPRRRNAAPSCASAGTAAQERCLRLFASNKQLPPAADREPGHGATYPLHPPAQRDVVLDVSRGNALLGGCQLHLPERNYCGFAATALTISLSEQQQVLCADPRTLNICPG